MANNWCFILINKLSKYLFEREVRRLHEDEQALIRENAKLGGSQDGFMYQGEMFSALEHKLRASGVYTILDASLVPQVESLLQDRRNTEFEQARVEQAFKLVLTGCGNHQDIRDALPDSMFEILTRVGDDFAGLNRTRPDAFTLEGNPMAQRQYAKLKTKIDFYVAARLIY